MYELSKEFEGGSAIDPVGFPAGAATFCRAKGLGA